MTATLEDNMFLAFLVAPVIARMIHYADRGRAPESPPIPSG